MIAKSLVSYGDSTYRTAISLYDGLLRLRETQKQTLKGGRAITETVYDSRGLVDWTSNPYYDMENTAPETTLVSPNGRAEIPATTQTVYDGAGRPTASILLGSGTEKWRTTTLYAGEKTSVIPPVGGTGATSIVDARGRQVELRQYKDRTKAGQEGAGLYDRQVFTYTKLDQTRTIVDNSTANTWSYEYDLRGRQTVAKDPDKGETDSHYDIGGRLEWTKDAAGHQLTYEYEPDKLGRKRFVHRGGLSGSTIAEWTYDGLKNGKGRLSKATRYEYDSAGKSLAYSTGPTEYTIDGQPVAVTTTIPSTEGGLCAAGGTTPCSFTTGYKYTAAGDLSQASFPAIAQLPKETTVVDFNSIGQQVGLFGSQIYAQNGVYNQLDQLIGQDIGEFGKRVGVSYGYDEVTGRQNSMWAIPELKTDVYHLATTTTQPATSPPSTTPPPGKPQTPNASATTTSNASPKPGHRRRWNARPTRRPPLWPDPRPTGVPTPTTPSATARPRSSTPRPRPPPAPLPSRPRPQPPAPNPTRHPDRRHRRREQSAENPAVQV